MAATDDGFLYDYENVAIVLPAYWRVGAIEFALREERQAVLYDFENVT